MLKGQAWGQSPPQALVKGAEVWSFSVTMASEILIAPLKVRLETRTKVEPTPPGRHDMCVWGT